MGFGGEPQPNGICVYLITSPGHIPLMSSAADGRMEVGWLGGGGYRADDRRRSFGIMSFAWLLEAMTPHENRILVDLDGEETVAKVA